MRSAFASLLGCVAAFLATLLSALLVAGAVAAQSLGVRPDTVPGGGINEPGRGNSARAPNASAGASMPSAPEQSFDTHDLDGDGMVSMAEAAGHTALVRRFERHDADRNGKLTRSEFEAPPAKLRARKPSRPDRRRPATR